MAFLRSPVVTHTPATSREWCTEPTSHVDKRVTAGYRPTVPEEAGAWVWFLIVREIIQLTIQSGVPSNKETLPNVNIQGVN